MTALSLRQIFLEDKYLVMHSIGSGHFGDIRVAKELDSEYFVAVKLEEIRKKQNLKKEFSLYGIIRKKLPLLRETNERIRQAFHGFPQVYSFGVHENYNYMVMDLLGLNIETLFNICNRRFSPKTVAMIGIQLLHRLEVLHGCNILYRDVKPENLVVGPKPENRHIIYMVDFGLSVHIQPQDISEDSTDSSARIIGTCRYMSINAHSGSPQSPWDDLESLLYLLCYLSVGQLPWQGIKDPDIHVRYHKVCEVKKTISPTWLCRNAPAPLTEFTAYIKNGVKNGDMPNYEIMHRILKNILVIAKSPCDWSFDWIDKDLTNSYSHELPQTHGSGDGYCAESGCCRCFFPRRNK